METEAMPSRIDFQGPFALWPQGEDKWEMENAPGGPGLYLFTVKVDDAYRIFYLGEAGDVAKRIRVHLSKYLTGEYCVYPEEAFKRGTFNLARVSREAGAWIAVNANLGRTLSNLEGHRRLLMGMLRHVQIFIAPLSAEKGARERIELALIRKLSENPVASDLLENKRRNSSKRYEDLMSVDISCKENLFGLRPGETINA